MSRNKGNHTLKFCQLVEYNMKNIFLEKSYTKYKTTKLSISLDHHTEML